MNTQFSLLIFLLAWTTSVSSQDSTVSDSVRAMIERSQATTQFEQTARMQVSMQYADFIAALEGDAQRRSQIEAILVRVLTERAELSARVTAGQASTADLKTVSDYSYLRERLAPLLDGAELNALDNLRGGPSDEQLKRDYSAELTRVAGNLTDTNRELVLETLVRHNRRDQNSEQLSVDDLVAQQSQSLMRVREELQAQLSGEQLQQVIMFLNQLQSNLYRNRSMSDAQQ